MTIGSSDRYILPTAWCDTCDKEVTCDVLAWEVGRERLATFVCPTCGRPLGVALHGQMSWTPRRVVTRRGSPRAEHQSEG